MEVVFQWQVKESSTSRLSFIKTIFYEYELGTDRPKSDINCPVSLQTNVSNEVNDKLENYNHNTGKQIDGDVSRQ